MENKPVSDPTIRMMMGLSQVVNQEAVDRLFYGIKPPFRGTPWYLRSLIKGDAFTPPIKRKFFR